MWRKKGPDTLLMRMQISTVILESSIKIELTKDLSILLDIKGNCYIKRYMHSHVHKSQEMERLKDE
jgi:hypothetical protein